MSDPHTRPGSISLFRTRAGNLVSQFEKFLTTQYTVGVKQAARQQIEKYSGTRVMKS